MKTFYFIGICGTGMASTAGLLKEAGYNVIGSDQNVYPPMSTMLDRCNIEVYCGYNEENIQKQPIDYIVVGNVLSKGFNVELDYAISQDLPLISFPALLEKFFLPKVKPIVVTGTHGKTTTSAFIASALDKVGKPSSFLVGGQPLDFEFNFKYLKESETIVLEGDEYDTAYFDKEPKFFHYHPQYLIINNIEFDHADIFKDLDHIKSKFIKLVQEMPSEGVVIANGCDQNVVDVCQNAPCNVKYFGTKNPITPLDYQGVEGSFGKYTDFTLKTKEGKSIPLSIPLKGEMQISNSLSVAALLDALETPWDGIQSALKSFGGVKRRLEVIADSDDITIYDDFAHHPTAVHKTLDALKRSLDTNQRIIAIFEPRNASSRRNIFLEQYAQSFSSADLVVIGKVAIDRRLSEEEQLQGEVLASKIGPHAHYIEDNQSILDFIAKEKRPGDQILIMSCGSFNNLHRDLINYLKLY